ncbi:hypothetical protein V8F06_013052 [Rhypophila decipiens]
MSICFNFRSLCETSIDWKALGLSEPLAGSHTPPDFPPNFRHCSHPDGYAAKCRALSPSFSLYPLFCAKCEGAFRAAWEEKMKRTIGNDAQNVWRSFGAIKPIIKTIVIAVKKLNSALVDSYNREVEKLNGEWWSKIYTARTTTGSFTAVTPPITPLNYHSYTVKYTRLAKEGNTLFSLPIFQGRSFRDDLTESNREWADVSAVDADKEAMVAKLSGLTGIRLPHQAQPHQQGGHENLTRRSHTHGSGGRSQRREARRSNTHGSGGRKHREKGECHIM